MTTPIPVPPGIPFLGNINNLDNELPIRAQIHLYKTYGEIYQLNLFGRKIIFVNSQNLANEISDEKRFKKTIAPALLEARRVAGDGLFTAYNDEPNWGKAHRLLMPAFGPTAIRGMYDRMADIASQLLLKWERFGPEHDIDPTDDFTRLALDTILLCSMSHRLNSFYLREEPEYATHMTNFLKECGVRPGRLRVVQALMASASAQFEMDADWLIDFSDKLVAERQAHPTDQKDLLNIMLNGKDPVTGEGLSAENIRYNLVTFTIAGHETTSGLLSFTMYYLLKHPESLARLRAEIDSVVGDRTLSIDDIPKLPYLNAVLRESIRLSPTAAARGMASIGEQIVGNGKYRIPEDATIVVHTYCQHRDPAIWGEDAEEFKPERMLDGKFEALPPNSWQPFGNGMRACIGRAFAWQEAQMVVAAIIQKFDISMSDPSYTLQMKSALTIKPKDFHMRARVREGREHVGLLGNRTAAPTKSSVSTDASAAKGKQVLHVLYGSNSGSSEAFAQRIAGDAAAHGFRAQLATLNSAAARFPSDGPVVIVTASYEGQPADNAAHFVEWLTNLSGNELANSSFAVFGCGSHEWPHTYQRIPRLIDDTLAERGAKRLLARGEGDSSAAEFFQAFDEFEDQLWEALKKEYNTSVADPSDFVGIQVKSVNTGTARATVLRQNVGLGRVLSNNLLTPPDAPAKRHIVIELPEDATYQAGDYLAVLAENHRKDVHRALARFNLSAEEEIEITATGPSSLPTGKPISASALLAGYVELSQPATARDLRALLKIATKPDTKQALETLISSYADLVLAKRLSVLDILESHPDIDLPFPNFLSLLPAMRIRQYSISSSSLADPHKVSVTMSVVEGPALSDKERRFYGVASTYLSGLSAGDKVQVSIRPAANAFRLPSDPSAPVVMFCAGAGVAPMRGFIEERAIQKASGRDVGQMVLFYGCRRPDEDFLFSKTDFAKWSEMGIVDVRPAFSRAQEQSEGCKYVQDRILHDRDIVRSIFDNNPSAKFFTCGSGKVGSSIEKALVTIIKDAIGASDTDAEAKFHRITRERYATDVFD